MSISKESVKKVVKVVDNGCDVAGVVDVVLDVVGGNPVRALVNLVSMFGSKKGGK